MKTRILVAGATTLLAAAVTASGASAMLVSPDVAKVTVRKASGPKGDSAGTGGKRETYGQQSLSCSDGNTVVYDGPLEMWPPNHKYRNLTVTATDDEPANTVTLTTTGTHDEYLEDGTEMNGAGNSDDDFFSSDPMGMSSGQGTTTTSHRIRGERSGRGDGRVYTVHALATFSDGESCEGDFFSTVPHDQGNGGGKPAKRKRARR